MRENHVWGLGGLVLGAGLAVALTLALGGPGAAPGGTPAAPAAPAGAAAPGTGPSLGDAESRATLLARELEAERAEHAQLKARAQELEAEVRDLTGRLAAPGKGPERERGPRFRAPGLEAALDGVDWAEVGEALGQMAPLFEELAEHMASGKEGFPARVGEIQRWNGPLVTAALGLSQRGVPGTGVNGSFTHPWVLVNLIATTLEAAGKPLDADQHERLGRLGAAYAAEDERRRAGYPEDGLALERLIDEARLKERFYAEADALLTAEQRDVLHPAAIRGRASIDLFSSGLILAQGVVAVRFASRAELEAGVLARATSRFGLQAGAGDAVVFGEALGEWVRGLPEAWLTAPLDPMARGGLAMQGGLGVPVVRLLEAAEHTLRLYRAVRERLPAGAPLAEQLADEVSFVLPVGA